MTVISLAAFTVLFTCFCVVEMALAAKSFTPKRIVVNRSLISSYMVNFFSVGSAVVIMFHLSLYFKAARGMRAAQVGTWPLPSIIGGVIGTLTGA